MEVFDRAKQMATSTSILQSQQNSPSDTGMISPSEQGKLRKSSVSDMIHNSVQTSGSGINDMEDLSKIEDNLNNNVNEGDVKDVVKRKNRFSKRLSRSGLAAVF